MIKKQMGNVLAATVGVLFASATFASATNGAMDIMTMDATNSIKCVGVNVSKDETATDQNSGKEKGFIMVTSEQECTDKGGTVEK